MKVEVNKQIFENILSNMQAFLDKKDLSQITSHIFIGTLENNDLLIKATDKSFGLKTHIKNANIKSNGSITVNGKKILDIVRRLKDDNIILESIKNDLIIKQNKTKFKLASFDAEEYPTFPTLENKSSILLNSSLDFINSLKKVTPSIDVNNPKQELNGALLDIDETSINIVSTDTKRLSYLKMNNIQNNKISIIVPKKAILEIQKIFFDDLNIHFDETDLIIKSNNYEFFTKLINGKFPDYKRIIPNETKINITLPKDDFINQIKLITSVSNNIRLNIKPHVILFESISEESSEAQSEFEIDTNVEENISIASNSRFLLDFLSIIDDKEFELKINSKDLPFILSSKNISNIIMPIIL
jgi:DNA polymerase-3 subunit beta